MGALKTWTRTVETLFTTGYIHQQVPIRVIGINVYNMYNCIVTMPVYTSFIPLKLFDNLYQCTFNRT